MDSLRVLTYNISGQNTSALAPPGFGTAAKCAAVAAEVLRHAPHLLTLQARVGAPPLGSRSWRYRPMVDVPAYGWCSGPLALECFGLCVRRGGCCPSVTICLSTPQPPNPPPHVPSPPLDRRCFCRPGSRWPRRCVTRGLSCAERWVCGWRQHGPCAMYASCERLPATQEHWDFTLKCRPAVSPNP